MKYENKRNGRIVELIDTPDEKYNTVFLRDVETGKEQTVTVSTLKRWYKKLAEQEEQVIEDVPAITTAASDCTVQEIEEPVVAEAADPGTDRIIMPVMEAAVLCSDQYRAGTERYLEDLGYELKADKSMPSRLIVRQGGKTCAELYFGKKAFKVNMRADRAEQLEGCAAGLMYFKVIRNYYLPATLGNVPYEDIDLLLDLFGRPVA